VEITPLPSFASSWPTRVEVRFHDAAGREIQGLEHRHRVELHWREPGAVALLPVEGQPFQWDVRVSDPCAERREFVVGYGHIPNADERMFGPIPVSVSRPVQALRLYGEDGLPREPPLALAPGEIFTFDIRLVDCIGEEITELEPRDQIQLYVDLPQEYERFNRVPGERASWTLDVPADAEWQVHISFGFGREGEFPPQVFGPFAIGLADPAPDD
jgi:hypothetical protein